MDYVRIDSSNTFMISKYPIALIEGLGCPTGCERIKGGVCYAFHHWREGGPLGTRVPVSCPRLKVSQTPVEEENK